MFCENYDQFVKNLEKCGYTVHSASNADEAKCTILKLIGNGSVGFGGSHSVKQMDIYGTLRENGNELFYHSECKSEQRRGIFREAANADFYICSTNAISFDGKLVNIDGTGNRVAAMFAGPKDVIVVIGRNKLTPDLQSAMDRAKNIASPLNAARLNRKTPCAVTHKCSDCSSPDRICNVTTIIEYKPHLVERMHLILVDEDMGY